MACLIWVCTKTRSLGIRTVLYSRLPDLHIFETDPSQIPGFFLNIFLQFFY